MSIVRTEGVTCHQSFILYHIGIHGVRPVQVRHGQETQCLVTDLHFVAVIDCDGIEVFIYDFFQEGDRCCCCDDLHFGIFLYQTNDGTSVVRFCMADYDIIDGIDIQLFCQRQSVIIIEFFLGCFKDDGLISGLQDIGVISCTKLCVHDNVEYFQVFIQNTCPVQVVFQLQCSHIIHLSYSYTRICCQKRKGNVIFSHFPYL